MLVAFSASMAITRKANHPLSHVPPEQTSGAGERVQPVISGRKPGIGGITKSALRNNFPAGNSGSL